MLGSGGNDRMEKKPILTSSVHNLAIFSLIWWGVGEHIDMERPQGTIQIEHHQTKPSCRHDEYYRTMLNSVTVNKRILY